MASEHLIAGLKQRSCEVGRFTPKPKGDVFTNCTFCNAVIHYEKGKKFFDCLDCGLTNYREAK